MPVATNPAFAVLYLTFLRFDMEKIRLKPPLKPDHFQCFIKFFHFDSLFMLASVDSVLGPRRQEWFAD